MPNNQGPAVISIILCLYYRILICIGAHLCLVLVCKRVKRTTAIATHGVGIRDTAGNMAFCIDIANGVIQTIRKHIVAEDALACACEVIGIDEAAEFGVVIAGLQIIETGFGIETLAGSAFGARKELSSFAFIIRHIPPHRKRKSPGIRRFQGIQIIGIYQC